MTREDWYATKQRSQTQGRIDKHEVSSNIEWDQLNPED